MWKKLKTIIDFNVKKTVFIPAVGLVELFLVYLLYQFMMIHLDLLLTGWSLMFIVVFAMSSLQCFILLSINRNITTKRVRISYVFSGIFTLLILMFSVWTGTNGYVSEFIDMFMSENNGVSVLDTWLAAIIYSLGLLPLLALTVKSAWQLLTNFAFTFED